MISKYISSMGLEFEGFIKPEQWRRFKEMNQRLHLVEGLVKAGDGSVGPSSSSADDRNESYDGFESVEIKFHSDDIKKLYLAIKKLYSEYGFKTNRTCGGHIHARFPNTHDIVSFFSHTLDAWLDFKQSYERYAKEQPTAVRKEKYLNRMNTSSSGQWCKFASSRGDILQNIEGRQRYFAINLTSYDEPQKTIEFRNMPNAKTWDEAIANINWTRDTIDRILDSYANRFEVKERIRVPRPDATLEEDIDVPVGRLTS